MDALAIYNIHVHITGRLRPKKCGANSERSSSWRARQRPNPLEHARPADQQKLRLFAPYLGLYETLYAQADRGGRGFGFNIGGNFEHRRGLEVPDRQQICLMFVTHIGVYRWIIKHPTVVNSVGQLVNYSLALSKN